MNALVALLILVPATLMADVRETVEQLASLGSRVTGYAGNERAADYIEQRFQALGLVTHRDTLSVVVPLDRGGRIEWEGESAALQALWPNSARTSTLPPEGVRVPAIWAGRGDWADFNGREVTGRVVVLDFDSSSNWLKAAALGARAVVFAAPDAATTMQAVAKFADTPLDVPRFWLERGAAEKLRRRLQEGEAEVALQSRMDWAERPAWNIWTRIPGRDPALADQVVLLHSYYDAPSVVPALAPGAEAAASIAVLLETARRLRARPPVRPVILAALGAHFQARQGMVDFLGRHARRQPYYARKLAAELDIDLFVGLDLPSHGEQVVLWNNTSSYKLKRHFVPFGRRFSAYAEALGRAEALANGISPIRGMDWASYMPGGLNPDGGLALDAGYPSLTLATVNDARYALDLPLDRAEHVDGNKLTRQSELVTALLARALDDPGLLEGVADLNKALKDRLRDLDVKARTFPRRSQVPDRPVVGALVEIESEQRAVKGVRRMRYYRTDERGEATVPGLPLGRYPLGVYAIDVEYGTVTHVVDLSKKAQAHHGKAGDDGRLRQHVRWIENEQSAILFPAIGRPFYGLVDPRYTTSLVALKVLSGTGTEPRQYGYTVENSGIGGIGVLYGEASQDDEARLKMVVSGLGNQRLLLLNSEGHVDEA